MGDEISFEIELLATTFHRTFEIPRPGVDNQMPLQVAFIIETLAALGTFKRRGSLMYLRGKKM
jgi:hypothetical protein